jgi:riboflavin biosynthesis pyrimidine reductase
MEIVWFTAMSMDGRIAAHGDDLGFLDSIADVEGARAGFDAFLASVDAIIVGAGTLRWLVRGGHGWPHPEKPTWAVSHDEGLVASVQKHGARIRRFEGNLKRLVEEIAATGARRVWLSGGGDLAGQLVELDLLDEVDATIAPAALGAGPGLLGLRPLPPRKWALVECGPTLGNAVHARWRRARG